jgi:SSS family solute:Na+ symporter
VFFFLNPELRPFEIHEGILGLCVNVPVLVGVSLATRRQEAEHVAAFVDRALLDRSDAQDAAAQRV